jgi:hypothetical protein
LFPEGAIVKSLFLILPASLLLASSADAQTQNEQSPQPESVSRVQVQAPAQPFQFRDYEAEAISGAYAMSNGWRLNVDPASDGIVAQIGKRHPFRLVAVSRDRYVSPDGNVSMEFNRGRGDDMLMSYVPDSRTAQVVVVTAAATLAQR